MKSPVKLFNELFKTNSEKSATRWFFSALWMAVKAFAALQVQFMLFMAIVLTSLNWINPPVSSLMLYRAVTTGQRIRPVRWTPLDSIPKDFQRMVVWLEDGRFYKHFGIDIKAIREAVEVNREEGRRVAGASTIDQQLARTLFLVPTKSYIRKYIEAVIAIEMDFLLPKDRILELYINSIEWGPGIFGYKNASYYHYGSNPVTITMDQRMKLAAIICSPLRYNTENFYRRGILSERYYYLVGRLESGDTNMNAATPIGLTMTGEEETAPALAQNRETGGIREAEPETVIEPVLEPDATNEIFTDSIEDDFNRLDSGGSGGNEK